MPQRCQVSPYSSPTAISQDDYGWLNDSRMTYADEGLPQEAEIVDEMDCNWRSTFTQSNKAGMKRASLEVTDSES
jgi:hypothetical protein